MRGNCQVKALNRIQVQIQDTAQPRFGKFNSSLISVSGITVLTKGAPLENKTKIQKSLHS